ncbi:hypothetical protein AVEN_159490-1 [Araneus ventricosus]|uniref:Uncharacterized protein n=1 Tax=Araneus ventricosus TaxID=182803 RepID=A0A4Y2A1G2_ARAVE|nr:hypothetical protein AVEN_159490-1 [Araneus ventricosus]
MIGSPRQVHGHCDQLQNGYHRRMNQSFRRYVPSSFTWPTQRDQQYYSYQGSENQLTYPAASQPRTRGAPNGTSFALTLSSSLHVSF